MRKPFAAVLCSIVVIGSLTAFSLKASDADFLAQETINVGTTSDAVLDRVLNDIRSVFYKYQPQVDSSSKITKPLRVTGSSTHPILQVSIQKCVLFVCKVVDLDAEVSVTDIKGNCQRNLLLNVDLKKSSSMLTDVYDNLKVGICLSRTRDGQGSLKMLAEAHHSRQYSTGVIQKEIFGLLQLQVKPIVKALNETIKEKKLAN